MNLPIDLQDRLALVGVLVGVFVVIVGLGMLLGMPWTTSASTPAVVVQMVGIVATIAVGLLLVVVTYADDPGAYLPG